MDLTEFRTSTQAAEPPAGLSLPLQVLWWEAKGDWHRAHACAQEDRWKATCRTPTAGTAVRAGRPPRCL
jgi:hypothetical protein